MAKFEAPAGTPQEDAPLVDLLKTGAVTYTNENTLEKNHYSNGTAYLDSSIPRETFIELADELVPQSERGKQTVNFGKEYISAYGGNGVATFADYENVSIEISGIASPVASAGDIVAIIKWKKRTCATPKDSAGTQ
jgi:hypothetical protein